VFDLSGHERIHVGARGCKGKCKALQDLGYQVFEPEEGFLACGYEGKGRLPSTEIIREKFSGPGAAEGHEWDQGPRHFRSYKGGHRPCQVHQQPELRQDGSIAGEDLLYRGAEVTMITGPVAESPSHGVRVKNVISADDMYEAAMEEAPSHDIIVKAAAVGDFSPSSFSTSKIKRREGKPLVLEMVPNRDIAAALGASRRPGQFIVGFLLPRPRILWRMPWASSGRKGSILSL
jgi:phosphopantothenoylcysteine decarboxylase/phosphopantothenate--cysteine ligase